jgi:hypothetical protein
MSKVVRLTKWLLLNWRAVTFQKIYNFLWALWNKTFRAKKYAAQQQYEWRIAQVAEKSPECISGGICVHCGCDVPEKFWERDACEAGCYPAWDEGFKG